MKSEFLKKHYSILRITELFFDFIFIIFSFLLVVLINETLKYGDFVGALRHLFKHFFDIYVSVLTTQISYIVVTMMLFVLYKASITRKTYGQAMKSVSLSIVMTNAILIIMSVFLRKTFVAPDIVAFTFVVQFLLFAFVKYVFHKIICKAAKRSILVIGPESEATLTSTKYLMEEENCRYLKYVLFEEKVNDDELIDYIDTVDDVIITQGLSERTKNNIITYCISKNYKDVYLIPKLYEIDIYKSKVDQISDTPVFLSQSLHLSLSQRFIKRTFDLIVSMIGIILALPFFIIIPIMIKVSDRGPVLYKQERVTRNNKTFLLYKFRTMIVDAEKYTGAVWQMENDPRITKVGKLLRATRIDELPQLINVLKGEMSLIGPRPEREIFIKEFIKSIPDFKYRVNVKPGITGLAQVLGKYNSEPVDKLRFDLIYIRNYSLFLDLKILFLTIKTVFDRDSSATLGIPKFNEIIQKRKLILKSIDMGYEVLKDE